MDEEKIPEIGTPEYDEYMIKKHDESVAQFQDEPEQEAEKPATELPEGVSMDDLLALWREKNAEESKGEEQKPEEPEEKPEENSEDKQETNPEIDELKKQLKELQEQQVIAKIYEAAGGEERFNQMKEAAEQYLDETQLDLLNMALVEGTPDQAVAAVRMLGMLLDAIPSAPIREGQMLSGRQSQESFGYATEADFHADLQNPLYHERSPRGEAYRQKVQEKLARSKF